MCPLHLVALWWHRPASSPPLRQPPMPSCGGDPAPTTSGLGRGTRSSLSAASRPTRKRMPHLAVLHTAANRQASTQAVPPPPSGSRFQTLWFLHLPLLRGHPATVQEPFFRSRTGFLHCPELAASSQSPKQQYLHRQQSQPQGLDL